MVDPKNEQPGVQPADRRQAWTQPKVTRLKAGEAEVGTRKTGDGQLTAS